MRIKINSQSDFGLDYLREVYEASDDIGCLVASRLICVKVSQDGKIFCLTLTLPGTRFWSNHYFYACGDCCSKSWIEAIELPWEEGTECPNGTTITSFMLDPDSYKEVRNVDCDGENVSKFYVSKIETTKGVIAIEFRNDGYHSNSGWLRYIGTNPAPFLRG